MMPGLLRNVLAFLAGITLGGAVNMALVVLSPSIIPPPAGVDVNDAYIPMAWLGARLGAQFVRGTSHIANHVHTLLVAFTVAAFPWSAEAQTQRVFENERVIAWRLESVGPPAEPLVRDRRLPGVLVALQDGAVRIIDDVNTVTTRDVAPASGVVLIAIKDDPRDRLEIPLGMIPAFPREGVTRVAENDRVLVWAVTWTKGLKTPPHFHDKDVVAVYLDPGTVRSIASNGEITATPRLAGDTVFNPRGRAHIEECIDGPRRDIIIELK